MEDNSNTKRYVNTNPEEEIETCDNPLEDSRYLDALDLIKDKKYDEAMELLTDVLEDCSELNDNLDPNCGPVNYYYAFCLSKMIFSKVVQVDNKEDKSLDTSSEQLFDDLEAGWECADFARVLLAKSNHPLLCEAYLLLGDIGRLQGNTKQALDDYKNAMEIAGDKTISYCNIGECYMDLYENLKFKYMRINKTTNNSIIDNNNNNNKENKDNKDNKESKDKKETINEGEEDNDSSSEDVEEGEENDEEENNNINNNDNNSKDNKNNSNDIENTIKDPVKLLEFYKEQTIKYYNLALDICNDKLRDYSIETNLFDEEDKEFKKIYERFDNKDVTQEEDKIVETLLYRSVLVEKLKKFDDQLLQDKFDEPTIKDVEPQLIEVRKRKKDTTNNNAEPPNKTQKIE